ncbi:hypothetical protein [Oceanithermus sp.]
MVLVVAAFGLSLAMVDQTADPVVTIMSGPDLEQIAMALNVQPDQVMAALERGSFRQMLIGQGMTEQMLEQKLMEQMRMQLKEAMQAGKLAADRYQKLEAYLNSEDAAMQLKEMLDLMLAFEGGDLTKLQQGICDMQNQHIMKMLRMGLINAMEAAQMQQRVHEWTMAMVRNRQGGQAGSMGGSGSMSGSGKSGGTTGQGKSR